MGIGGWSLAHARPASFVGVNARADQPGPTGVGLHFFGMYVVLCVQGHAAPHIAD